MNSDTCTMVNNDRNAKVCDTTKADSSNGAGYINKKPNAVNLIVSNKVSST
jgi:hypothetical protein